MNKIAQWRQQRWQQCHSQPSQRRHGLAWRAADRASWGAAAAAAAANVTSYS